MAKVTPIPWVSGSGYHGQHGDLEPGIADRARWHPFRRANHGQGHLILTLNPTSGLDLCVDRRRWFWVGLLRLPPNWVIAPTRNLDEGRGSTRASKLTDYDPCALKTRVNPSRAPAMDARLNVA